MWTVDLRRRPAVAKNAPAPSSTAAKRIKPAILTPVVAKPPPPPDTPAQSRTVTVTVAVLRLVRPVAMKSSAPAVLGVVKLSSKEPAALALTLGPEPPSTMRLTVSLAVKPEPPIVIA
ncbi:MAG: hypothetical protein DLM58_14760 [Pseudonocardiales bacterium]|nr:MAG: hypothetical protein DLM58_14760 [Pseudonocardiales bacterium]